MTDRRRDNARYDQGGPGFSRLAQRLDEGLGALGERMEAAFDRIDNRMARIEKDVAQGDLGRENLASDIAELRRDLGELRDAALLGDANTTEAAAKGAAAGATEAAGAVAAAIVHPKSKWEKMIAWAVGFTALVVAANNVPDAIRGVERAWAFLGNRPHAEAETEAETKAETTDGE